MKIQPSPEETVEALSLLTFLQSEVEGFSQHQMRNGPRTVSWVLLLMDKLMPQLVGRLSMVIPLFTRFIDSRWCRISSINSMSFRFHLMKWSSGIIIQRIKGFSEMRILRGVFFSRSASFVKNMLWLHSWTSTPSCSKKNNHHPEKEAVPIPSMYGIFTYTYHKINQM